ncbi:MAG: hypothetical protein GY756_11260 [bacterium]|nr:hypothetical protein [bacterium]
MQINGIKCSNNIEIIKSKPISGNNNFSNIFDKSISEEMAKEITNKYNVHLHNFTSDYLSVDNREIDNVLISGSTLKKMSTDIGLRNKVLKHIEVVSSKEWKAEVRSLIPPVKKSGVIIYEDGSALYWSEAESNNTDNNTENTGKEKGQQPYSLFQNFSITTDNKNSIVTDSVPELLFKKYLKK